MVTNWHWSVIKMNIKNYVFKISLWLSISYRNDHKKITVEKTTIPKCICFKIQKVYELKVYLLYTALYKCIRLKQYPFFTVSKSKLYLNKNIAWCLNMFKCYSFLFILKYVVFMLHKCAYWLMFYFFWTFDIKVLSRTYQKLIPRSFFYSLRSFFWSFKVFFLGLSDYLGTLK